jgi:hypothetical protein
MNIEKYKKQLDREFDNVVSAGILNNGNLFVFTKGDAIINAGLLNRISFVKNVFEIVNVDVQKDFYNELDYSFLTVFVAGYTSLNKQKSIFFSGDIDVIQGLRIFLETYNSQILNSMILDLRRKM